MKRNNLAVVAPPNLGGAMFKFAAILAALFVGLLGCSSMFKAVERRRELTRIAARLATIQPATMPAPPCPNGDEPTWHESGSLYVDEYYTCDAEVAAVSLGNTWYHIVDNADEAWQSAKKHLPVEKNPVCIDQTDPSGLVEFVQQPCVLLCGRIASCDPVRYVVRGSAEADRLLALINHPGN